MGNPTQTRALSLFHYSNHSPNDMPGPEDLNLTLNWRRRKSAGPFADKSKDCANCDFFHRVKAEEGDDFTITPEILEKLKDCAIRTRWADQKRREF